MSKGPTYVWLNPENADNVETNTLDWFEALSNHLMKTLTITDIDTGETIHVDPTRISLAKPLGRPIKYHFHRVSVTVKVPVGYRKAVLDYALKLNEMMLHEQMKLNDKTD